MKDVGFFSDPKVFISIAALIISLFGFVWTLFTNWDQNQKWEAINLGKLEISDVGFIMWKEFTREEATKINWGYNPTLFSYAEHRLHTGKYRIPYELILIDPSTLNKVKNCNGFFTISEGINEINRLGLKIKPEIRKHFQIQYDFKNLGQTNITDINIAIKMKDFESDDLREVYKSTSFFNLEPNTTGNAIVDFNTPINFEFPNRIIFHLEIHFKNISNEDILINKKVEYISDQNYWVWGVK